LKRRVSTLAARLFRQGKKTAIIGVSPSLDGQLCAGARAVLNNTVFSDIPILARPERIEKLTCDGYSRPLSLSIETVNICNNNCVICAYSSQTRKRQVMPLEMFAKALNDYRDIGGGNLCLTPTVGDVFLDSHLPERIGIIKRSAFVRKLSVTTNGVMSLLMDDSTLDYVINSFDRVKISIYGLDAEEYRLMTQKDEYERAVESISRILKYARRNVVFGIRQMRKRPEKDIQKWVKGIIKRAGYRYRIEVTESVNEYANWSALSLESRLPFDAVWRTRASPDRIEQCLIPLVRPIITSAGDLSYCHCANYDASRELVLGNINDSSLRDLFNSQRCKELYSWERYGVPDFCRACSFYVPICNIWQWPSLFSDPWF
jgi:MoaA/NifB/PqqE/SkfB family radical SAM enzyme